MIPALRDAANDKAIRGEPLRVYLWLVTNLLDTQEMRPVKITGLSVSMRIKRHTVTRALKLLTIGGYLERRYVEGEGYYYRAYLVRRHPLVPLSGHTPTAA